ncbi:MAG: LysM peptidoglycan-binding domain-containing protein, partial [Alphaproteobacteria bacterium]
MPAPTAGAPPAGTASGPAGVPASEPLEVATVTVQPGDTLYGIARRNDVPVRGLIVLNRLEPPYRLRPGQQLVLPAAARLHTVVQGDTTYSIARRYGVTVADMAELNALDPPGRILLGQQLVIPGVELRGQLAGGPDRTAA